MDFQYLRISFEPINTLVHNHVQHNQQFPEQPRVGESDGITDGTSGMRPFPFANWGRIQGDEKFIFFLPCLNTFLLFLQTETDGLPTMSIANLFFYGTFLIHQVGSLTES